MSKQLTQGFQNKWLYGSQRDKQACVMHSFTVNGQQLGVLAAIDKDKQPMSLYGTASTTNVGNTFTRHFTVRYSNGDWQTKKSALLD